MGYPSAGLPVDERLDAADDVGEGAWESAPEPRPVEAGSGLSVLGGMLAGFLAGAIVGVIYGAVTAPGDGLDIALYVEFAAVVGTFVGTVAALLLVAAGRLLRRRSVQL
jgi:hypothetical protein